MVWTLHCFVSWLLVSTTGLPAGVYNIQLVGIVCIGASSPTCTFATADTELTVVQPPLLILVNGYPSTTPIRLLAPSTSVTPQVPHTLTA